MDPYRNNLDSLRAQAAELDRLLSERRSELAALRMARLLAQLKWLLPAAMLVGISLLIVRERRVPAVSNAPAVVRYPARVVTSSLHGLAPGARCEVELAPGCLATISCTAFRYRGQGRCDGLRYLDDGPEFCEISGNRIMLRSSAREASSQRYAEKWAVELVRE